MPKNRQMPMIYFFLIVITLSAYWQVGSHGFVNLDDDVYVTENHHIQNGVTIQSLYWTFTTGYSANWHPLTWISHMLDIQFFGLNPRGHHLTNLLFHISNVLLLFFLLYRMSKALWQSAFVAALFALHPLHVESVAWIAERKDVLSTLFWMLTLVAYTYYAQRPRLRSYLPVFAFFALGLMAKPMLVTLPFVMLLLDYWPLERFRTGNPAQQVRKIPVAIEEPANNRFQWAVIRPLLVEKIPLLLLAALSCAATYAAQNKAGAVASIAIYSPAIRMGNALVAYTTYIAKAIWPDNLAVLYPHPGLLPLWHVLGAALFLVAITCAVLRISRRSPYLPLGWLWFTGTLVPVIGIVQVGDQAMADRYTYIPLIGLFIMAAWGVPEIFRKHRYGKELLAASSALCLLCLVILTRTQVGYWHDGITLSDHALSVTKDNCHMYIVRGLAEHGVGNYKRAIEDYGRAIEIYREHTEGGNDSGFTRNGTNDHMYSPDDLNRMIEINPLYADAYNNRGCAYESMGNHSRAIEDFDRATEIDHGNALAYANRAAAYIQLGDRSRAIEDLNRAIQVDPCFGDAYYKRGSVYHNLGDFRQAINDYDKAIENDTVYKVDCFYNRGIACAGLGDQRKAIENYDRAIEINPEYTKAYFYRGVAYEELGDQLDAIHNLDMAIRINPEYAEAYYCRGFVYARLGNESRSLEDMKKAEKLGYEDAVK